MSDGIWRVEVPALNGVFPGVNSMIVCDCGNQTFEIGTEVDLVGNKYIRYAECAGCGKQTRMQRIQVQFPGVSNMMICDCSCQTFKIGTKVDLVGRKYVRCIECADCGKQTAVSLRSAEVRLGVDLRQLGGTSSNAPNIVASGSVATRSGTKRSC